MYTYERFDSPKAQLTFPIRLRLARALVVQRDEKTVFDHLHESSPL